MTGEGKATQSWRWGELPSPPVVRTSPSKPVSRPVSRDTSPVAGGDGNQNAENSNPGVDGAVAEQRTAEEESQRSMLGHMFSLLRQTKKIRNQAALSGGIYLDDFNELDPELAALYLPQSSFRQGLGQSVPTNFHPKYRPGVNISIIQQIPFCFGLTIGQKMKIQNPETAYRFPSLRTAFRSWPLWSV